MPYFPLSDEFHSAPELLGASDAAVALYARAASWSAFHLTDGHVPSAALPLLTSSHEQGSAELVERKVWRRTRGGFQFVSWPKEATRSNVEAKREASKRRQQKHRSTQDVPSRRDKRVTNTVTDGVTNGVSHSAHATPHQRELSDESSPPCSPPAGDGAKPPAKREPDRFDEFWQTYPKRVGKQAAIKAWRKALGITDADTIIEGARRYAASRNGEDPRYTAHPTTWLNGGRWDDEPAPAYTPPAQQSTADQRIAELQARKRHLGPAPDDGGVLRALPQGRSA